jgi:hypothetical protein
MQWLILAGDWQRAGRAVGTLTALTLYPAIADSAGISRAGLTAATLTLAVMASAFAYSYACFTSERRSGSVWRLLQLPLSPFELVVMKYVSLYSMVLFTFSAAAVSHRDWRLLMVSSGAALFLSTCLMASSVVSPRPWVPHVPLWSILLLALSRDWLAEHFAAVAVIRTGIFRHALALAVCGMGLSPIIALSAAAIFARRRRPGGD